MAGFAELLLLHDLIRTGQLEPGFVLREYNRGADRCLKATSQALEMILRPMGRLVCPAPQAAEGQPMGRLVIFGDERP